MNTLLTKDTWESYSRLVLKKLDEHDNLIYEMNNQLSDIKVDIGMLKVKAGIWGLIGGMIPVAIELLILGMKKF